MGRREDVLCLTLDPVKILLGVYLEGGVKSRTVPLLGR
jgi:hypothetical protein